jgi:hypothetical protein
VAFLAAECEADHATYGFLETRRNMFLR